MIPQEKIEQAAKLNVYKHFEESEAFKDGFYKGTRFAEAEMKQIMNEYGQWLADMWSDDHAQCHYNPELYTKFNEERGSK